METTVFTTELMISAAAIAVLLVLSAFFSGSETSLTAASRPRMHNLEQQHGSERARIVNLLLAQKERLIGSILLGNNLVNILASALATSLLIGLFGDAGVAYATVGMTVLVLIFAEVLPKTYAIHNADRFALAIAPVMRVVVAVLSPVTQAALAVVRLTLKLFGVRYDTAFSPDLQEEELRGAIDLHAASGEEERHEREMLRSVLDLADVNVEEIMTHRSGVATIDVGQPTQKLVEEVLASPDTRIPLWRDDPDNIVGVLHAKALFRAVQAKQGDLADLDVLAHATAPWFIPDTTDLFSQLQAFRSRHEHFAIVVDEYGEVLGIVTLEDILEEIVGDISDEHDIQTMGVRPQPDGSVTVEGAVAVRDLNRAMDWTLPDEEATTIAGLVIHEARTIPEIGQAFTFYGFTFEVLRKRRNQLTLLRVRPLRNPG